ncbi:MAG: protein kinase, partial [Planctomycetes bacterium]|nr:protein kinase [Planctomycetota bacterium]
SRLACVTGKAIEELKRLVIPTEPDAKPEAGDPLLGKTFGRYKVKGLLGLGGWGNVYLAESEGRQFAIKVLRLELGKSAEHLDRFMTEARITASLEHDVIRRTVDIGKHHGYHYMAMEYVNGASIHAMVSSNGPLPAELASQVTMRIAEALRFAIRRGIVHRDIKPRNVLVSRAGEIKLTDFGLAKMLLDGSSMTSTGAVMGTPEFMSPEQFDGARADQRSDIYALGCTLFFMLTGNPPFTGPDYPTLMRRHKTSAPPSPLRLNPDVPAHLCSILSRMLEKQPSNRFQDYDELLEALSTGGGHGTRAPKVRAEEGLEEAWMDEERVKRCAEVQAIFQAEEMVPPPRWHVMLGLGYASGGGRTADDKFLVQPVVLGCSACGRTLRIKSPPRAGLVCPVCGSEELTHPHFEISRHACFLFLRIGERGAALESARDDLIRTAALACLSGAHNVILDFSACAAFPSEVIGPLLRLRELLTAERVAPVLIASPKGLKQIKERGMQEFFLAFASEKEVVAHIDTASLCPHLRYFLCAVRGQLADPEDKVAENLSRGVIPCLDRAGFDAFYPAVREAVKKADVRSARAACATLAKKLAKAPCLQAAAAKATVLVEDAIRLSLEHSAQAHLARGRTDRARITAKETLAAFPESSAAADILAQVALQEGRPVEAAGHFGAAARGAPSPEEYKLSEAAAFMRAGDTVEALRCVDEVLRDDPLHFRAEHFKGTLHFSRGEYEEAIEAFSRALEVQPSSPEVLLWRGRTHHRLDQLAESLRDFVAANRLEPGRARTLANCGAICARLGKLKEAVAFLKSAIHLNPAMAGPRYNLSCALSANGDLPAALHALREAVAAGWSNRDLSRRDPLLKALREDPEFREEFAAVLAEMPTQGETEDY